MSSIGDSAASELPRGVSDARASPAPADSLKCPNAGLFYCMCMRMCIHVVRVLHSTLKSSSLNSLHVVSCDLA